MSERTAAVASPVAELAARPFAFDTREPFVSRRCARSWPAVTNWTPERLGARYPAVSVVCKIGLPHGVQGGLPYRLESSTHERTLSMSDFVALLGRSSLAAPSYMNQASLRLFPGLAAELRLADLDPRLFEGEIMTRLWIGSAGTRSGLHVDPIDNLYTQVYGRKRVLLAPPTDAGALYPFPDVPSKSQVDPEQPDFDRHPRYARAGLLETELGPGDVLFLPRLYWHHFRALEPSISVSHWFGRAASPREWASVLDTLGPGFVVARRLAAVVDFARAFLGRPRRRLYAPPSQGTLLGQECARALRAHFRFS